ncbi:hypothetical protein MNB_SV-6-1491 [hydrothermal vent metagenome]|uniref:Uncharacterized protein n=1 Tax=hydrothermal vent metagenome TaxID=652676 RepID=A0A1W1CE80_9ZZZZ
MNIRNFLIRLRGKIDSSPELKIKIMLVLDKMPMIKNRLKKIGKIENRRDIEEYDELSKEQQRIYLDLKNSIEKKGSKCV